jgi:hypothetical protein
LKPGGGLLPDDSVPSAVHILLRQFAKSNCYKNPTVPLSSQFLTYLQNGLSSLGEVLLKYISPVYNACPFKVRTYLNGKREVLKNTSHPAYEKWDSLLKRIHFLDVVKVVVKVVVVKVVKVVVDFDDSYLTT